MRHYGQTIRAIGVAVVLALLPTTGTVLSAEAPNFGYAKDVSWHLDGAPELSAMESTIHRVLDGVHVQYPGVEGQTIEGFYPGPTYTYEKPGWSPFYVYVRDTATDVPMVRYYYGAAALRTSVEEFLRQQYPDGSISATIGPDHKVDKATVVSDEETSAVLDATETYDAAPDPAWLSQSLRGQLLIDRLNRAMSWVLNTRRDTNTQLIKRAHTTDWGDIKWEPNSDPSHMRPGDQWTVSIYDQAIAYAALQGLARLNAAAGGHEQDRARWLAEADDLRAATNLVLWQDDGRHGFYRIHRHVPPDYVIHNFPEDDIVSIGNAAAIYYGLADADKVPRILAALERARLAAGALKPGLTLQPAYDDWFQVQMDPRMYQNGAIWDWWGGRQISAEFWSGYWQMARDHLLMVARDWATHPGKVREWESPWIGHSGADQGYAGAAAVVGQSVVEGLFGVSLIGNEVRLAPRLEYMNGGVRVYEPATDLYVAYEYQASERGESLQYGSNSPTALSIRLPVRWRGETRARMDGHDWLPVSYSRAGQVLLGTVIVPSGTHKVDLFEVPSGRRKF